LVHARREESDATPHEVAAVGELVAGVRLAGHLHGVVKRQRADARPELYAPGHGRRLADEELAGHRVLADPRLLEAQLVAQDDLIQVFRPGLRLRSVGPT